MPKLTSPVRLVLRRKKKRPASPAFEASAEAQARPDQADDRLLEAPGAVADAAAAANPQSERQASNAEETPGPAPAIQPAAFAADTAGNTPDRTSQRGSERPARAAAVSKAQAHGRPPRSIARRSFRMAAMATSFTAAFIILLVGVLAVRLAFGPIAIEGLSQRVSAAMNSQIGAEWRSKIRAAKINHAGLHPALTLEGVEIFAPDGQRVLLAPEATVAVDPWSLVWGQFRPRSISFSGITLRIGVSQEGEIDLRGGADSEAAETGPSTTAAAGDNAGPPRQLTDVLARGAASFIELLTSSDGFLGGIDDASVNDATVILLGADGRPRFRFTDTDLLFSRPKDNLRNFSFELTGGKGRWRLEGAISGRAAEDRVANISFNNVPVSDLLAFGAPQKAVWTDMPLSGNVNGAIRASGELANLTAQVAGERAVIHTDDPDMPQFTMDQLEFAAAWRGPEQRFDITRLYAAWDGYHIAASGALERGADGSQPWLLRLGSTDARAAPFAAGDAPTPLQQVNARLAGTGDGGARIEQFDVVTGSGTVSVTGQLGGAAAGQGVDLTITGANAGTRTALALWPTFAARHVRDYIGRTFSAGRVDSFDVRVKMTRDDIIDARHKKPMDPEELAFNVRMSDAVWRATPHTPPVYASAAASGDGALSRITISAARMTPEKGPDLQISKGEVLIRAALRPTPRADIHFNVKGDLPTLLQVMDSSGLGAPPVNPGQVRGAADLDVTLSAPLSAQAKAADIVPTIRGALSDVSIDKVSGDHRLDNGAFQVTIDEVQTQLKGEGRIAGVAMNIDLRDPRKGSGPGEIALSATFDDASRNRLGVNLGAGLSGPVSASAVIPLDKRGGATTAAKSQRVDIDLTRARIDDLIPGWSKAAGKPGKVSFLLDEQNGAIRLNELTLEAGNVAAAKGVVELDAKAGLQRARFGSFRMSPSDNMRVEVDRADGGYKVTVRGQLIDARPALRAIVTDDGKPAKASGGGAQQPRIDLDLSTAILAGYNNEALTNASLKLTARNGEVRQASMDGRFGAATASLRLTPRGAGAEQLDVRSSNAGALLRFADFYKRMYGGDLIIQATLGRKSQSGAIDIARFALRDEPALARIVASQPANRAGGINVSETPFTRLEASFDRQGGRVQLRDGIIWGPQVGIKLDGVVDFARDRTDLNGVFIPAYALNNAFARIPLVGPLIGGGANEGLFAVSFRITGPASAPTLTVNPLTAVAPGILRKFIEVFTPDGSGGNQPAAPPTPPARIQ